MDGILIVDKPKGYTSHDVVAIVKRAYGLKKVGHTGTLDPLATGVLPLCINAATKIAGQVINADKAYQVTLKWGESTDTYDAEGTVTKMRPVPDNIVECLSQEAPKFVGELTQTPPAYSAVKVAGKPLYWWARSGKELHPIPTRLITVYQMRIIESDQTNATLEVSCSKGTFIRSLVHDLGEVIGCGAHVIELRRLQSGVFKIDNAITLDEIKRAAPDGAALERWIIPLDQIKHQLLAQ